MFSNWSQEKTMTALVDAVRALADKLAGAKPHIVDHHAAALCFWAGFHASDGLNLQDLIDRKSETVTRFAATWRQIAAIGPTLDAMADNLL